MHELTTPVLLSYNEEENIGRSLDRLGWAADIVVVDSLSTDATVDIVRRYPQARLFQRPFDTHAQQWNFAIQETGIKTPWILALDADYILPPVFVEELARLAPTDETAAYAAEFTFCIWGEPIRGALYPSVTVLFRKGRAQYLQDGHTQRLKVNGRVAKMQSRILHDDRKPLSRWLAAQDRYMKLESAHLTSTASDALPMTGRLRRRPPLAPLLAFFYAYIVNGGWRDGRRGLYYALQRMLAESLLALYIIERQRS